VKIIHIYDKIYRVNIYVSYGHPRDYFIKDVKCNVKQNIKLDEKATGHMHYFRKDNSDIYWVWTEKKSLSVLLHEFLHVTAYVLMDRGIKMTWNNHEPFCYYQQFLFNEFLMKGGKNK